MHDSVSMLGNGDIDGLLDWHRRVFGALRMEGEGGDGSEGGSGSEGAGGSGSAWTPPASQADLDRIINERLSRQKAQYKDFDTYKSAHDELQQIKAANQTEAEKAAARAEAAEKAVAAATERAVRAEVKAIATGEFADPTDAHLYLGDLSRFVDKDGEIDSSAIEAALKEVEKAKPHLVARTRTDVGLGTREGAAPTGKHLMNQQIRQAAGR